MAQDLAGLGTTQHFDFSGYLFDHVEVHECNYNWKTFIEVYLEDYHVVPFHPGLGSFVSCDDLTWEFGDWYSVQTVGVHNGLARPGSPVYRKWHDEVLRFRNGKPPEFGAIWMVYYPGIMIEWYPHVLVVSWLIPHGPQKTTNVVEFYYPEEIALFEREFVEAERAAYMETAREDDEIAERMDAGRRALMKRGESQVGPYQSPMEDGMQHFHEFCGANSGQADPCDRINGRRASVRLFLSRLPTSSGLADVVRSGAVMPHTHYTTLISAANLAERLAAAPGSLFICDCRFDLTDTQAGEKAYAAGHIPDAHYMHLDQDLSGTKTGTNGRHPLPERTKLAQALAARGLQQGQQVVAYDAQGGMYAARLWWLLRWLGHDAVALLDGGLHAWEAGGQPLTRDVPAKQAGDFRVGAPRAVTVDAQAVQRNLSTHERTVIDARAADRYRGENETLDRIGGHIPGALNRFFKDNLTTGDRFKPAIRYGKSSAR